MASPRSPSCASADETLADLAETEIADGDVIVEVPDTAVIFAGDLVRESGAPWFADSYPLDWPRTFIALEDLAAERVVPGHGNIVDKALVNEQRVLLTAVSEVARAAHVDGRPTDDVAPELPLKPRQAKDALMRAYRQLSSDR